MSLSLTEELRTLAGLMAVLLQEEPTLALSPQPASGGPNKPAMSWETTCQLSQLLFPGVPKDLKLMSETSTSVGLGLYKTKKFFKGLY